MRPLHVESWVTSGRAAADPGGGAPGLRSSSRVVREPGRWPRLAAIIAVLGLAAGAGGLLVLGTGEPDRAEQRAGDPRDQYLEAVQRLGYARSFAYRGSVHAAGSSPLRPGASIATDVTVVVTWPAQDPQLVVDVEISGHNHPQDIAPPDRGPAALRRIVPVEALEAENIRPQELGRLPERWRLTGAWVDLQATPSLGCPLFNLVYLNPVYGDPEAGFGDYIWLGQTPEQCGLRTRAEVVGDPQPFAVRTFEGSVVESSSGTIGFLSDGTTAIQFEADLPVDDVAVLLASLRPFEPDAEPEPPAATSTG